MKYVSFLHKKSYCRKKYGFMILQLIPIINLLDIDKFRFSTVQGDRHLLSKNPQK